MPLIHYNINCKYSMSILFDLIQKTPADAWHTTTARTMCFIASP